MNDQMKEPGKAFGHRNKNEHMDLFQTHYSLTWQLLEHEKFKGDIHEPFCGLGAIHKILYEKMGSTHNITCADKNYNCNFINFQKIDFLEDGKSYNNIISNPPYGKLTDDLIIHAKKHTKNKIALLLRTNYLSGTTRLNKGVFTHLEKVYVFSRMPDLKAPIREDGKYPTGMIVYAWFIWDMKMRFSIPIIQWIDNQEYVLTVEEFEKSVIEMYNNNLNIFGVTMINKLSKYFNLPGKRVCNILVKHGLMKIGLITDMYNE